MSVSQSIPLDPQRTDQLITDHDTEPPFERKRR